jgi:hypothetical protein
MLKPSLSFDTQSYITKFYQTLSIQANNPLISEVEALFTRIRTRRYLLAANIYSTNNDQHALRLEAAATEAMGPRQQQTDKDEVSMPQFPA